MLLLQNDGTFCTAKPRRRTELKANSLACVGPRLEKRAKFEAFCITRWGEAGLRNFWKPCHLMTPHGSLISNLNLPVMTRLISPHGSATVGVVACSDIRAGYSTPLSDTDVPLDQTAPFFEYSRRLSLLVKVLGDSNSNRATTLL
jgi:hypothetical protein